MEELRLAFNERKKSIYAFDPLIPEFIQPLKSMSEPIPSWFSDIDDRAFLNPANIGGHTYGQYSRGRLGINNPITSAGAGGVNRSYQFTANPTGTRSTNRGRPSSYYNNIEAVRVYYTDGGGQAVDYIEHYNEPWAVFAQSLLWRLVGLQVDVDNPSHPHTIIRYGAGSGVTADDAYAAAKSVFEAGGFTAGFNNRPFFACDFFKGHVFGFPDPAYSCSIRGTAVPYIPTSPTISENYPSLSYLDAKFWKLHTQEPGIGIGQTPYFLGAAKILETGDAIPSAAYGTDYRFGSALSVMDSGFLITDSSGFNADTIRPPEPSVAGATTIGGWRMLDDPGLAILPDWEYV